MCIRDSEDTERGMKLGDLERMNKDVAKDIDSNILTFKLMHDELVLHEDEKQEKQRSEERILF